MSRVQHKQKKQTKDEDSEICSESIASIDTENDDSPSTEETVSCSVSSSSKEEEEDDDTKEEEQEEEDCDEALRKLRKRIRNQTRLLNDSKRKYLQAKKRKPSSRKHSAKTKHSHKGK